jgi:hypothetical protein
MLQRETWFLTARQQETSSGMNVYTQSSLVNHKFNVFRRKRHCLFNQIVLVIDSIHCNAYILSFLSFPAKSECLSFCFQVSLCCSNTHDCHRGLFHLRLVILFSYVISLVHYKLGNIDPSLTQKSLKDETFAYKVPDIEDKTPAFMRIWHAMKVSQDKFVIHYSLLFLHFTSSTLVPSFFIVSSEWFT